MWLNTVQGMFILMFIMSAPLIMRFVLCVVLTVCRAVAAQVCMSFFGFSSALLKQCAIM